MNAIFRTNDFQVQVIAAGAFADTDPGFGGKLYLVEIATVRLNHIALQEEDAAHISNFDFEEGERRNGGLQEYERRQAAFKEKLAAALGYDLEQGTISFKRVYGEVFTVVHCHTAALEAAI